MNHFLLQRHGRCHKEVRLAGNSKKDFRRKYVRHFDVAFDGGM